MSVVSCEPVVQPVPRPGLAEGELVDVGHALVAVYAGSALIALAAGIGAWRRRRQSAVGTPLSFVMFGLVWWSAMATGHVLLADGPARQLVTYLVFVGGAVVVAGFYCEVRVLLDDVWRPDRRTLLLLSVHPLAVAGAALSNPWHQQFMVFGEGAGEPWLPYRPGPLLWLHTAYCYVLSASVLGLLLYGLRRTTSPLLRRQLRAILLAALVPALGHVITLARPGGEVGPDLTPAFLMISIMIHYYAVFRQGLLRLLPVARELVLENVSDAIFVVDVNGNITDVNPAARRLARRLEGDLPNELIGVSLRRLLPSGRFRRVLTDGEYHVDHPDGGLDLDLRISDLADRHSRPLGRVVVARDVTELNDQRRRLADVNGRLIEQLHIIDRLRQELVELATRDELTNLYNRRYLMVQLAAELKRSGEVGCPLTLVLLDVDHFKSVNDQFGHAAGDSLLVAIAHALSAQVRPGDTVVRYGGEEFVILLPGVAARQAVGYAEVIRRRCSAVAVDSPSGPVKTTVSIGLATYPDCASSGAALLQGADEALYAAKRAGRDRVVSACRH